MKKLFISLVAIAAAVFATSCTNDLVDSVNGYEGKTAKVGIEVSTPELATRTFGDGTSATNLYYGVYDEAGVLLPEISVIDTAAEINIKTTVNLELVTGDTYTIVFWAENAGSAATIDWANKKMTFDPTTASKEEYDAFYGKIDFTVDGPATLKADLFRPFAQVNIGTADYEKAQKAGMTVQDVMVKVKGFDTLDLFSAEATNVVEHEYAYAVAPTEKFPVAGYEYMSMNYVLVNATKHLVDVEMTYRNTEGKEYDVVYGNVPVQRNYRTNIYGNLLTDQTGVIVEIKPAFEDDAAGVDPYIRPWDGVTVEQPAIDGNTVYIATGEQLAFLANAINTGATFDNAQTRADVPYANANVVLTQDIDLNNKAWTPIKQLLGTFDGQGHTIKNLKVNEESDKGSAGLFASARNVKNLTIDGFKVYGHYKAGAITGDGLCSKIENCHVKNGEVISTVVGKDNANHVGGIVGYLSAELTAYVKGCSVENVTVKGYRDVGAIAGTANQAAVVEKCVVKNVAVTADMTAEYAEVKAPNAGEIVGRVHANATVNNNYAEGVEVVVLVNSNSIAGALKQNAKNIEVTLAEDTTVAIGAWTEEYYFGGANTETITINGNNKKLTFDQKNGDWNYIRCVNDDAKWFINNVTLSNSGKNDGPWNRHDIRFYNAVELNKVTSDKAIALLNDGKLNQVAISDEGGVYGLWITAEGQKVEVDGLTITCVDGRAIAIKDQYVDAPAKVALTVKNSTFTSKDKAAVLVTSTAGADIVWGEGNDISGVAADTQFAVWVDEDRAAYDDLVTVTGCYKKIEGTNATIVTNAEQLTQALADKKNVICLQSGVYEGTFKPTVATKFVGAGEVVIKGRVNIDGYGDGSSFENIKFEINDASKVKNSFTGTNYKYPAIVVIYASGVKFENCEFACDINAGVCGINYAAHAAGKKLVVNNCSFKGDFYAIRTRTLFEVTNSKFDIHTDEGTLAAVWTWGNGNPWANEVTFTGNTNINANEVYGVQMTSTTFTYNNIAFNVQGNTGFYALADATSSKCTYKDNTFAAGSETF